jgi:hypothetical protein
MRDIDLLTRPAQAARLHTLLRTLGFQTSPTLAGKPPSGRHLPELHRQQPGLLVSVEVHDRLFDSTWRARPPNIDEWIDRARPFDLDGTPAYTLSLEDMLWHTYQHMINEEIRLAAVADMVSLCEKFSGEIDWASLHRRYPALPAALALFHALAPLDEGLVQAADLSAARRAVRPGPDRSGWPVMPIRQARAVGLWQFLRAALLPGEWWLRLFFGLGPERALWPYRWLGYPLELLRLCAAHLRMKQKQRVDGH